ncbi:B3 domain-containing protein Os01g0905400-like [Cornus florida]|uniref:B3 domain-containing protein Os01g0905400-like n=1 Tax=Cornus florida TaxID=4283 RepID=UPI00289FAF1B|nr:B3 domain-containing protein Os01g0905400-like [Cornus florida]
MGCNLEACAECTENCLLIHGKKNDPSPTITSFFKVMIGDDFSKVMFLPPKFARTVSALVGQKTHLEDAIGRRWIVTVSKINGSIAFQKGWHGFSLDHDLEVGDFLVFNYIKGSHFVVQIYGKTGCHKPVFSEKSHGRNGPAAEAIDIGVAEAVESRVASSETSHFSMNSRNDDSARMDKIIFMSRKDSGSGNTSGHLLDTSAAEAARNRNSHTEMSNMVIKECQNAKKKRVARSTGSHGVFQKEGTSLMEGSPSVLQKYTGSSEFCDLPVSIAMQNCQFGKRMQVVEKEREMCSHEETRHGRQPKVINECGQGSSSAIKDNNKGDKVLKTEPVDSIVFSSLGATSSVVGDGQSFLELPTSLPSISFKGRTVVDNKNFVFLRDPVSRLWTVLYHEEYGFKVLGSGWEGFSKANNLQPGDQCVFSVENALECIFRVGILRK